MTTTTPPYRTPGSNGLAIASFVLALFGFGIIPIVMGHVALRQIRSTGQGGTAFAVIGLILGYLTTATVVVALIIAGIVIAVSVNAT